MNGGGPVGQCGRMAAALPPPAPARTLAPSGSGQGQSKDGGDGTRSSGPDMDMDSGIKDLAISVVQSCPPDMHPSAYIAKLKQNTINRAKESVSFKKLLEDIHGTSSSRKGGSGSGSKAKEKESGKTNGVKVKNPLPLNKLKSTIAGLIVRRERFLGQDPTQAVVSKTKLALENESLYFLRALSSGVVELLEHTLGTPEERRAAEPGKRFRPVPDEYRKVLLDACTCMVYTTHNCFRDDRNFDPKMGGVNYVVDFMLDYLVVNRVDCGNGRMTFEFVAQVMEKLRTTVYQELFLKGLLSLLKSTFSQMTLVRMNEKKEGIWGTRLIDSLFLYFQLVESLLLAMRTIDETTLLTLKSFERVSLTVLVGYPLITVYAARVGAHAQRLFSKLEVQTPAPSKRKLGDRRVTI